MLMILSNLFPASQHCVISMAAERVPNDPAALARWSASTSLAARGC